MFLVSYIISPYDGRVDLCVKPDIETALEQAESLVKEGRYSAISLTHMTEDVRHNSLIEVEVNDQGVFLEAENGMSMNHQKIKSRKLIEKVNQLLKTKGA